MSLKNTQTVRKELLKDKASGGYRLVPVKAADQPVVIGRGSIHIKSAAAALGKCVSC